MERALRSGRWDSICCGKQPLNILEVVGLRAPTAVAECHRHSAKSRHPSVWSGRWDLGGGIPFAAANATAVETCHWHVSKSRLSNPTFGAKNNSHPNGWLLFWRRRWDSNPRGVLPPTRFRVIFRLWFLAEIMRRWKYTTEAKILRYTADFGFRFSLLFEPTGFSEFFPFLPQIMTGG